MKFSKYVYVFILKLMLLCTSCNYFKIEQIKREDVKASQLKEIKKSGLQNYPQIDPCDDPENSKQCFENQLISYLSSNLNFSNAQNNSKMDTIWLTVQVQKNGDMSLRNQDVDEEFQEMISKIDSTLQVISPIEPAHINGVKVNCNFKLPIVIHKN